MQLSSRPSATPSVDSGEQEVVISFSSESGSSSQQDIQQSSQQRSQQEIVEGKAVVISSTNAFDFELGCHSDKGEAIKTCHNLTRARHDLIQICHNLTRTLSQLNPNLWRLYPNKGVFDVELGGTVQTDNKNPADKNSGIAASGNVFILPENSDRVFAKRNFDSTAPFEPNSTLFFEKSKELTFYQRVFGGGATGELLSNNENILYF